MGYLEYSSKWYWYLSYGGVSRDYGNILYRDYIPLPYSVLRTSKISKTISSK